MKIKRKAKLQPVVDVIKVATALGGYAVRPGQRQRRSIFPPLEGSAGMINGRKMLYNIEPTAIGNLWPQLPS